MRAIRASTLLASALSVAFVACSPSAPRIVRPDRVEAFCGSRQARLTGVASVIASTDGKLLDDHPTFSEIRRSVQSGDGVIAYWPDQPLAVPNVAAQLGETDGYAHVRAAAIPSAPEGAQVRHIYLRVRDHGGERWITMAAYDVADVCVEGKRDT